MDIILSKERVDDQECDLLVTGFFKDERPLKESTGWIDWRLNGMLSQLLIEKRLTGEWEEATLIPSQGRILPKMILLLGLGEVKKYSDLLLYKLPPYLLETFKRLGVSNICLSFPYAGDYSVDCAKMVKILIEGIVEGLVSRHNPVDEEWSKKLKIHFAEGEENYFDLLLGVQTVKSTVEKRILINLIVPIEENQIQKMRPKS